MKYLLLPLLLLGSMVAQADQTVVSSIEDVTVFLRGAEIHRSGKATLTPGLNTLHFEGLTESLDPNSIQVTGGNDVTILQVTHRLNYLNKQRKSVRVLQVEDSLSMIQEQLSYNTKLNEVYAHERAMILANKQVKGENTILNIEDIEDVADFYRQRLEDIFTREMRLNKSIKELTEVRNRLQQQLRQLRAKMNRPTSEIVIEVKADVATRANIDISYMTYAASWSPTYDLRAEDTNEPVMLNYRAFVTQNTGVDWMKVDLVLSTGNPSQNNSKPNPRKWELNFVNPQPMLFSNRDMLSNRRAEFDTDASMSTDTTAFGAAMEPMIEKSTAIATAVSSEINVEFKIKVPYTIPSDGQNHQVHIQDNALPATYRHYTAPKYDQAAFLLARITGWDELNLLSGPANVYFQGTYVGKSYVNTQQTSDTLDLSLGRDRSIVVKRQRVKDFTAKKTVGNTVRETIGIEITIRNQKGSAVELFVEDQIPVSANKEIEVELVQSSKAVVDKQKGFLRWRSSIEPSGVRKLVFVYSVKYPKDTQINL